MFSYGVLNIADITDRNVYRGVEGVVAESALAHDGLCEVMKGSVGNRFANIGLHGGGLPRCRVEVEMGFVWGRNGKWGWGTSTRTLGHLRGMVVVRRKEGGEAVKGQNSLHGSYPGVRGC